MKLDLVMQFEEALADAEDALKEVREHVDAQLAERPGDGEGEYG